MTGRVEFPDSTLEAVAGIADGATVLIGGFGSAGQPMQLIEALREGGAGDLTVVSNNAGGGDDALATLIRDGRGYLLEYPLPGDVALIVAQLADELGNLVYRKTARNFGPIMAAAAAKTIAQVDEIVPVGALDLENVVTPCLYVDGVVRVDRTLAVSGDRL